MSLLPPEDPDPLLAYSTEPGGTAAKTVDPLLTRVEQLARELEESKHQNATLTSEMATLVGAVADIRKQMARPSEKRRTHAVPAIVGLLVGVSLGVLGWMYLSNEDVSIASPTPVSAQVLTPAPPSDTQGLAPNVVQTDSLDKIAQEPKVERKRDDRGLAPTVARTNSQDKGDSRGQPPSVKYVGTLSIDAEPGGEVFLNREPAGHTPLRLTNLRAGSHLIWIEREGYRRFTRVVQVPADRVSRLSAELEPIGPR